MNYFSFPFSFPTSYVFRIIINLPCECRNILIRRNAISSNLVTRTSHFFMKQDSVMSKIENGLWTRFAYLLKYRNLYECAQICAAMFPLFFWHQLTPKRFKALRFFLLHLSCLKSLRKTYLSFYSHVLTIFVYHCLCLRE